LLAAKAAKTGVEPGSIPTTYVIEVQPGRYKIVVLMSCFISCTSAWAYTLLT
jgi:hypothetical protein